ncbi:uncharacterized protein L201_007568 [Kwoniella dendrophila CBS 6074]|uniref:Uncharacterized protein n=1 Tax=Kwoniella dendrophila CBS 6074 TaxID=1295534 RepID=A0AAX4K5D7_9TREE
MYDPQQLTFLGKINALIALGRIPLASEVPLWTIFGCILSARLFPQTGSSSSLKDIDWLIVLQCAFITWATNISINYGNEYFDWNLDRPGQIDQIKKSIKLRNELENGHSNGNSGEETKYTEETKELQKEKQEEEMNEKIMGNTTRIIHDGTFPPYTALLLGIFWQGLVVALILWSRSNDSSVSPTTTITSTIKKLANKRGTPFKGFALQIGIVSSILSQMYVGPPIRLHYHGFGELISALLLNPVSILWGMTGYYTSTTKQTLSITDIFNKPPTSFTNTNTFSLGSLWILLGAMYCFEQARIFIMHIQDIEADIKGNKITFVVRIGHKWAARLYVLFNLLALGLFRYFTNYIQTNKLNINNQNKFVSGWIKGISLVLIYSIPIMLVTARSLFASIPPNRITKSTGGLLPALPLTTLPMIVSLQVLLSPIVLSIFTLMYW